MLHIYVGAVVCGFRCLLFGKFLGTSSSVAYYFDFDSESFIILVRFLSMAGCTAGGYI